MRVSIRKIVLEDLSQNWVDWLNDEEVVRYSQQRFHLHTMQSQKEFLEQELKERRTTLFGIFCNDKHVGNVEISNIDKTHLNCEIMYVLGEKNFWGKGIGSKAVNLALEYAFNELGMEKIYASIYANNLASQKVLLKNNFQLEGRLRSFFQYGESRVDRVFFGLLKEDFKKIGE